MTTAEHAADAAVRPANPLTTPTFRNLWLNTVTFFLVANAQRFVFGWLVLDGLLRSESVQGLVAFTLGLPAALLVLQAGAWADRWDRRKMLIISQVVGGVVMAATAIVVGTGAINLAWVILATLLAGAASAVGSPVRSALIPALVAKDQLFSAIALNAIAITLSMILGPVLAKVAGDQFGFEGAFWFQAILLFVGVVFLIRLEVPPHEDPHLKTLFGLLLTASLTINPAIMVTLQAHVKGELGTDAGQAATAFALMGVGIAITSFVLMRKGDMKNKGAIFQRAMMCGAAITFLTGRTTTLGQVLVLAFVMGLAGGFFINMNQGLVQANTPQALMGRVMGLYTLVSVGLLPFGALAIGLIASQIGTGNAISGAAAIAFVVVVTTYVRNAELRSLG
jgi:MFS family permease